MKRNGPARTAPRLLAAGLLLCAGPCFAGAAGEFARETLSATGSVLTAPARLDKSSALWAGGVAAGGLLAYSCDGQFRRLVRKNKSGLNDTLASGFEKFGDGLYEAGLLGLYAGGSLLLDRPEGARTAALAAQAFLAANAAGTIVKAAAGRARPYEHRGKGIFRPFRMKSGYTSFPSGHTTSAFALASVFARRWDSPWAGAAAYAAAAGTALERVYDDKHWLSDVVAGAALGTAAGRWIASPSRAGKSAMLIPVYSTSYAGAALTCAF